MTRETKIGLLVGLAFIIVIGILLSDHLTSATDPPQAQLTQAGSNVRQGVSVPGAANNPPVTTVQAPAPITPQQPIPTKEDLTPKAPPVQIVQIGPAAQAHQQPVTNNPVPMPAPLIAQPAPEQPLAHQPLAHQPPVTIEQPVDANPAAPPQPDALTQVARQIGEEIVGLTEQPSTAAGPASSAAAPAPAAGKPYKAQDGDTLSKLAGRFLGANTKANRDLIIKANPSLEKNPDIVVVGRTYIIPAAGAASAVAPAAPPAPATPAVVVTQTPAPSASPEYWYTVKESDTLRRIAVSQLGDEDAWAAIQDLNKTTLKGEDKTVVIPGMKLRLPAKPVASAN